MKTGVKIPKFVWAVRWNTLYGRHDSEKKRIGNEDGMRIIELCQDLKEVKESLSVLQHNVDRMDPICDSFSTVRRAYTAIGKVYERGGQYSNEDVVWNAWN
jgi:hypothetical protein